MLHCPAFFLTKADFHSFTCTPYASCHIYCIFTVVPPGLTLNRLSWLSCPFPFLFTAWWRKVPSFSLCLRYAISSTQQFGSFTAFTFFVSSNIYPLRSCGFSLRKCQRNPTCLKFRCFRQPLKYLHQVSSLTSFKLEDALVCCLPPGETASRTTSSWVPAVGDRQTPVRQSSAVAGTLPPSLSHSCILCCFHRKCPMRENYTGKLRKRKRQMEIGGWRGRRIRILKVVELQPKWPACVISANKETRLEWVRERGKTKDSEGATGEKNRRKLCLQKLR